MIKYIFQALLFLSLFFNTVSATGMQIEDLELSGGEVFIPSRLGKIKLYNDPSGFYILKENTIHEIQPYNCDAMLREICARNQLGSFLGRNKPVFILLTPEELINIDPQNILELSEAEKRKLIRQFLAPNGYITVGQLDNGEYTLRAKMRLLGGVKSSDVALAGGTGLAGGGLVATGTVAAAGAISGTVGAPLTVIPSVAALEAAIPGLAAGLSMAPGSTLVGAGGTILATGTTQTLLGAGIAAVGWPVTLGIVFTGGIIGLAILLIDSTSTPITSNEAKAKASPVKKSVSRSLAKKTHKPTAKQENRDEAVYEHEMLNHKIRNQLKEALNKKRAT